MVTGIFTIPVGNVGPVDRPVPLPNKESDDPPHEMRLADSGVPPYVVGPENALVAVIVQELVSRAADTDRLTPNENSTNQLQESSFPISDTDSSPISCQRLGSLIVIHGPSGMGKSHLLSALASTWRASHSLQTLGYWNTVDWARQYVQAIRGEGVDAFHKQLDPLQMLVLDDLDRLAKYPSAQRSLCSWLDRCQWHDKIVLIGCTQHPNSPRAWAPDLTSRLQAGLLVRVAAPGLATRETIIQNLARQRGFSLTSAAVKLISQRVVGTPRDLQTTLLRCQASVINRNLTTQSASRVLRKLSRSAAFDECQVATVLDSFDDLDEPISLRVITRVVARYFDLTQRQLTGRSRRRGVAQARGVAIYLCRNLTNDSFKKIGRYFDGRDHSTIVHSYEKTKTAIQEDTQIQQIYHEINNRLGSVSLANTQGQHRCSSSN